MSFAETRLPGVATISLRTLCRTAGSIRYDGEAFTNFGEEVAVDGDRAASVHTPYVTFYNRIGDNWGSDRTIHSVDLDERSFFRPPALGGGVLHFEGSQVDVDPARP